MTGIFFIGMVLWSDRPPNCPNCPPAVVLPALSEALKHSENALVVFETGLTLQKLVAVDGHHLVGLAWDWIMDIIESFLQFCDDFPKVKKTFVEIMTDVQQLVENGTYTGSTDVFFAILDRGIVYVNEPSVILLMNFQALKIKPSQPNWIAALNKHVQRSGIFRDSIKKYIYIFRSFCGGGRG